MLHFASEFTQFPDESASVHYRQHRIFISELFKLAIAALQFFDINAQPFNFTHQRFNSDADFRRNLVSWDAHNRRGRRD